MSLQYMSHRQAAVWRELEVFDGSAIRKRWNAPIRRNVIDDLPNNHLCNDCQAIAKTDEQELCWKVESKQELIRLVGALQHYNPRCNLWFRGESDYHVNTTPSALRGDKWQQCLDGMQWIKEQAGKSGLLRNRGEIARLAILQHYGIPTPLIDVTKNIHIAAAFATKTPAQNADKIKWNKNKNPHVIVIATPRIGDAVNVLKDTGICVVDLMAELPSHCLRPHVQDSAFIGLIDAVKSCLRRSDNVLERGQPNLDPIRVARICLCDKIEYESSFNDLLFPKASIETTINGGKHDNMNGDYLLQLLKDLKTTKQPLLDFPSFYRQ